jgi:hypothetical protein
MLVAFAASSRTLRQAPRILYKPVVTHFDQIKKMQEYKDWKEFINRVLIDSGQFEKPQKNSKNQTETEFFTFKKNPQSKLKVGYLNDRLIYCNITNPSVPGYNKYVEGIYFYANDFKENDSYGDPALEFNEMNRNGILSILKNGLSGKEIQFVKNNKVLKSKLYILESDPKFNYSYDFTGRNFWTKLFNPSIEKISGIEKREIELNRIFGGI